MLTSPSSSSALSAVGTTSNNRTSLPLSAADSLELSQLLHRMAYHTAVTVAVEDKADELNFMEQSQEDGIRRTVVDTPPKQLDGIMFLDLLGLSFVGASKEAGLKTVAAANTTPTDSVKVAPRLSQQQCTTARRASAAKPSSSFVVNDSSPSSDPPKCQTPRGTTSTSSASLRRRPSLTSTLRSAVAASSTSTPRRRGSAPSSSSSSVSTLLITKQIPRPPSLNQLHQPSKQQQSNNKSNSNNNNSRNNNNLRYVASNISNASYTAVASRRDWARRIAELQAGHSKTLLEHASRTRSKSASSNHSNSSSGCDNTMRGSSAREGSGFRKTLIM
eukprot:PhM_4_TR5902/c0_g1_i3/m.7619